MQTMSPATVAPSAMTTSSRLGIRESWDHVLTRIGYRRSDHRVLPGLYALGAADAASPVFVTANYTLSFDAVRAALRGISGYILVLDTDGVNVWCAAGKGTFGTEELIQRIAATRLDEVVSHRRLIVPQLGASGVCAAEVQARTGFRIEFGPVRASDLPEYLREHQASEAMRQVNFGLADRLVVVPIEITHLVLPALLIAAVAVALGAQPIHTLLPLAVVITAMVIYPLLLPWLPTRDLTSKGFILGLVMAAPLTLLMPSVRLEGVGWHSAVLLLGNMLVSAAVVGYLALNFTGSTTFTSRTGVKREIATYIPILARCLAVGLACFVALAVF